MIVSLTLLVTVEKIVKYKKKSLNLHGHRLICNQEIKNKGLGIWLYVGLLNLAFLIRLTNCSLILYSDPINTVFFKISAL